MQNNIKFKDYIFIDFPKPLTKEDYQEVCRLSVKHLKKSLCIKSIYLGGGEWAPGISDLDIEVSCQKDSNQPIKVPSCRYLSKTAEYLFYHNIWPLSEKSFVNMGYLSPGMSVRLLWGKNLSIRRPEKELNRKDLQFFNAIVIFDFLVNKLLLFPRYLEQKQLDVRQLLGEIYSFTYTLKLLDVLELEPIQADFSERITKLRNTWFNTSLENNLQELLDLLQLNIDLILETVIRLEQFVQKNNLPTKEIIFQNRLYYITFEKQWTKEKFLNNFKKGYLSVKKPFSNKEIKNFKLTLPYALSYFMLAYASGKGVKSDLMRKSLKNYKGIELPVNGTSWRIDLSNEFVQESIDYNFAKIPFSYGFIFIKQTFFSSLGEKIIFFMRKLKK